MAGIGNLFDSILEPFDDIAAKVGKMTGRLISAPSKLVPPATKALTKTTTPPAKKTTTPPAKRVTGGQKPSGTKPGRK